MPSPPRKGDKHVTEQTIIRDIELDQIEPFPGNRKVGGFDETSLNELAQSIKETGVHEPAIVRPLDGADCYQMVAGERRWRASRIAGADTLPCIVRELDDAQVIRIQVIENLQRENVHPLDEATGYKRLEELGTHDVGELAAEIGKSKSYVYGRLKLMDLVDKGQEALISEELSVSAALLIARLPIPAQKKALKANQDWWKLRDLENYIRDSIYLDLNEASFNREDPGLVDGALPCAECPKRTGYEPALFDDVAKEDFCLDGDCFTAKQQAYLEDVLARLQSEGADPLLICDGYSSCPDGAVPAWKYHNCEETDAGAQLAIVVAGPGIGSTRWVTTNDEPRGWRERLTDEEREAYKQSEIARKAALAMARDITLRLWNAESTRCAEKPGLDRARLECVAAAFLDALDWNATDILKRHGVDDDPDRDNWDTVIDGMIKSLSDSEIQLVLMECSLVQYEDRLQFDRDKCPRIFTQLLESNGIDLDAVRVDVEKAVAAEVQAELAAEEQVGD